VSTEALCKLDIMEVMSRYALASDNKNYDLLRSLFSDDATIAMQFDSDFLGGQGVHFDDPASFIAFVKETATVYRASQHLLGNPLIDIDGEVASIRVNLIGTAFYQDTSTPDTTLYGFYEVALTKMSGSWKIQKLTFTSIGSK